MTNSGDFTLWVILALIVATVWIWLRSRALRLQSGVPDGNIIYTDGGTWFPNNEILRSEDFCLSGKPDYLVEETDGAMIPVELKSGLAPAAPREGHVLQLAAYCLLVEECFGRRPEYGILQYRDKAFAIDYSDELEEDLLDLLAEMREATFAREVHRDHSDPGRCQSCGVRRNCHQRLS